MRQVLHGHANNISDIYSIYVTDYTSKAGTFVEHSSDWCPVSLADRVLRIEMWRGEAVALAQQMKPGEYWSLDNVRMKYSNGGYIEGSFSEAAKARKLSVADIDMNHHLLALLKCVLFIIGGLLGLTEWFLFSPLAGGRRGGKRTMRIRTCFRTSCLTKLTSNLSLIVPSK
jgi:hypothetical protein